jgi:peptidoglycan/xylan/chitin deacetylase (PgdA/CDA1 family)
MLKATKRGAIRALNSLGLSQYVQNSAWRSGRLLILCYHGISHTDEHEWDPSLYMNPADFEGRLRSIKRSGCAVLPLSVALERLYANALHEPTVVITFDDGLYDFARQAYPLLEKYGFPVTVYLTTYYCEHEQPVFPVFCSYLLWKGAHVIVDAADLVGVNERWDLRTDAGRSRAFRSIIQFADRECLTAAQKDTLAEMLARRLGVDYETLIAQRILQLMNPREVTTFAAKGVDFQLHTHRHYAPPDRDLFLREIEDNRERIRTMVGSEPTHFCYPCGVYDPKWLPWLAHAGVVSATTVEPGLASSRVNPLLLPRLVDTSRMAPVEFDAWLTGVGALLPRRSRRKATRPFSEATRVASVIRVAGRESQRASPAPMTAERPETARVEPQMQTDTAKRTTV